MATRAKYKVGECVLFRFAGTETEAEIVAVRKSGTEVSYKTLSDDGTIYPVSEKNVIGKV